MSGCVAQQEGRALLDRYRDVDLVFGPDAVPNIRQLVTAAQKGRQVLDTDFLDSADYVFASELDPHAEGQVSAFVTIQKAATTSVHFASFQPLEALRCLDGPVKSLMRSKVWLRRASKSLTARM